jgi:hypothetical protein
MQFFLYRKEKSWIKRRKSLKIVSLRPGWKIRKRRAGKIPE